MLIFTKVGSASICFHLIFFAGSSAHSQRKTRSRLIQTGGCSGWWWWWLWWCGPFTALAENVMLLKETGLCLYIQIELLGWKAWWDQSQSLPFSPWHHLPPGWNLDKKNSRDLPSSWNKHSYHSLLPYLWLPARNARTSLSVPVPKVNNPGDFFLQFFRSEAKLPIYIYIKLSWE